MCNFFETDKMTIQLENLKRCLIMSMMFGNWKFISQKYPFYKMDNIIYILILHTVINEVHGAPLSSYNISSCTDVF